MSVERIGIFKVNLSTETQEELQNRLNHLNAKKAEVEEGIYSIEHTMKLRFGLGAVAEVIDFKTGRTLQEFELDVVTDDFEPTPPRAA